MYQKLLRFCRFINITFIEILAVQAISALTADTYQSSFGEFCNQNNNLSFDSIFRKCNPIFICHQNKCKCPVGYGFYKPGLKCIEFSEYLCENDTDCNSVDNNRLCNLEYNKCECNQNEGFYETKDNKVCRSRQSFLNDLCNNNSDCTVDYSYCKNNFCQCWPEFEAQVDHFHTSSNQKIQNNYCKRKICSANYNCQTDDNPNLICNNTICECEYGFGLDNQRICIKLSRRQNCNITCQIIGGLFASIFMLSLIYWCFYCCYSIVNNYKLHNRPTIHSNTNSAEIQRLAQRNQLMNQSINENQLIRNENNSINASNERYYYLNTENPPTYSQLADEPPDYETVVHMKAND